MKNLLKDKAFKLGWILCLFIIVGGNLFAVKIVTSGGSLIGRIGFPFRFYRILNDGTHTIYWINLVCNLLITLFISLIVGLIFKFVWSKFQTNNLR